MTDAIFRGWLERQYYEAMALAQASDLLELAPLGPAPAQGYVARFHCRSMMKAPTAQIVETNRVDVAVTFFDDYLRVADPYSLLTVLDPSTLYHPNAHPPFLCIGDVAPGTPLVELLFRVFDVLVFANVTMVEHKAMNKEACAWARCNIGRFPLDTRALKRRPDVAAGEIDLEIVEEGP